MKKGVDTWRSRFVTVLLTVMGIIVLAYPVVASQWNNARQQAVARQYAVSEHQVPPQLLERSLARAEQYNRQVPGAPILDPWLARVSKTNNPYQEYLHQLNLLPEMGRLIIPKAHINLSIYHGTTEDTLQKGIGHLYGSSLPVGGVGTHAVLTGHSGLSSATLLDNLSSVRRADEMYVQVAGRKLKYQVHSIQVVRPNEVSSLARVPNKDLLTVITCTPYGINSHRLLVTGHKVPLDPKGLPEVTGMRWSWWMILIICICVVAALLLMRWLVKKTAKDKLEGGKS